MFKLEIKTDAAAFGEQGSEDRDYDRNEEVADILRKTAERILNMEYAGTIRDVNGAEVGTFELTND